MRPTNFERLPPHGAVAPDYPRTISCPGGFSGLVVHSSGCAPVPPLIHYPKPTTTIIDTEEAMPAKGIQLSSGSEGDRDYPPGMNYHQSVHYDPMHRPPMTELSVLAEERLLEALENKCEIPRKEKNSSHLSRVRFISASSLAYTFGMETTTTWPVKGEVQCQEQLHQPPQTSQPYTRHHRPAEYHTMGPIELANKEAEELSDNQAMQMAATSNLNANAKSWFPSGFQKPNETQEDDRFGLGCCPQLKEEDDQLTQGIGLWAASENQLQSGGHSYRISYPSSGCPNRYLLKLSQRKRNTELG
ncbi:hypothetical protein QAD02_019778 [Eretmocerus hayati]|uniref:Uncharacterized protein n=1 Tax=Eretmocerus hayati TaxID=131215 RepID=A0ACC2PLR4_9HYME|nr:hypothetical protein QAD02_019778 [Eretmocerus hayati]